MNPLQLLEGIFSHRRVLATALIISCFGLVMVGSASSEISSQNYGSAFALLTRHGIYLVFGITAFLCMSRIPFAWIETLRFPLIVATVVLLVLVLIPGIGREVNGASRWIVIAGLSMQPSEIAKFTLLLYLAVFLGRLPDGNVQLATSVPGIIVIIGVAMLIMLEPDFGTALVLCASAFGMFFISGLRYRLVLIGMVISGVLFSFLLYLQPYRLKRFEAILDPWAHAYDSGYQITQALMAIGRGGWFGSGLGKSIQKFFYLPEAHTDFLIAVTIEELGLLSGAFLLLCYVALILNLAGIARRAVMAGFRSSGIFVYGIFFYFFIQSSVALGVNLAVLPTTGISLPLFSYGGTNMLLSYALLGCAQSIARKTVEENESKRTAKVKVGA